MPYRRALVLNEKDNVANLLEEVQKGETVEIYLESGNIRIEAKEPIPFGFKMAITKIDCNNPIIKYGQVIGIAVRLIQPGDLVHVHNLAGARGRGDLSTKMAGALK
jgi:altronate dehydratase small subunit